MFVIWMISYNTVLFVIWLFAVLSTRGFILYDTPLDIDCFVMWVSSWFGNESQDKLSAPAHWQIFCEWNSLDRHTHQQSTEANNLCEKKLLQKKVAWKKDYLFCTCTEQLSNKSTECFCLELIHSPMPKMLIL